MGNKAAKKPAAEAAAVPEKTENRAERLSVKKSEPKKEEPKKKEDSKKEEPKSPVKESAKAS